MILRLLATLIVCLCANFSLAQRPEVLTTPNSTTYAKEVNQLTWNKEEDKPLAELRALLEAQYKKKGMPEFQVYIYQKIADAAPKDARAQFRWAYSQYLSYNRQVLDLSRTTTYALSYATQPRSYEYVRLRFMYETNGYAANLISPLGRRLIEFNPLDVELKTYVRFALLNTVNDREAVVMSTKIANEIIASRLDSAIDRYRAGQCYWMSYGATDDPKYAREAIAKYREFLKMASPTDENYKPAQNIIKMLTKELAGKGLKP